MAPLAQRLAEARLSGATVTATEAESPADPDEAYTMQAEVAALLGPMSEAWKVGSTSREAQEKLGTDQPGSARVPARYRFQSGDAVPVHDTHDLWVEGEFALRLGVDLPERVADYTEDEVRAAVDGVAPALEIVGSRLAGGLAGAGRYRITADGGANIALVTGAVVTDWRGLDLPTHGVRLMRNGESVAEGTGARALGDPMAVMVWLANHQRARGGMKAGEIVSTGTCTGLVRVAPGDVLMGDFGTLGSVEARLAVALSS